MVQPDNNAHVREDFLGLVPESAERILDIGCGEGLLSRKLKDRRAREVAGVEIDGDKAKKAAKVADKVIVGDIETVELPFNKSYFDCILYGDILEHLKDPWAALKMHRGFLKEDGCVICSMPNVRYYKIVRRLLAGYWDYTDAGPMAKDHLRFFTLVNIREMFEGAGYEITGIVSHVVAPRAMRILNMIFLNRLKDFLAYQYYIIARKTGRPIHRIERKIPAF